MSTPTESLHEKTLGRHKFWIEGPIEQVNPHTTHEQRIKTFKDLETLDKKLAQLVGLE